MSSLKEFDRVNLRKLKQRLNMAIADISEEFGISIQIGMIRYSDKEASTRITMSAIDGDKKRGETAQEAHARIEFERNASKFGLAASDFGKVFMMSGSAYKITGLEPRRKKYPVLATEVATGEVYKFTADVVTEKMCA